VHLTGSETTCYRVLVNNSVTDNSLYQSLNLLSELNFDELGIYLFLTVLISFTDQHTRSPTEVLPCEFLKGLLVILFPVNSVVSAFFEAASTIVALGIYLPNTLFVG